MQALYGLSQRRSEPKILACITALQQIKSDALCGGGGDLVLQFTHRLHGSSLLGLSYRIPNMSPKKELLWSVWVVT